MDEADLRPVSVALHDAETSLRLAKGSAGATDPAHIRFTYTAVVRALAAVRRAQGEVNRLRPKP